MTSFQILPVTSLADLPTLSDIFDACTRGSSFEPIILSQYGPDEDGPGLLGEAAREATKEGIESPDGFVFKAVDPEGKIVGYSQWYVGRNRGDAPKDANDVVRPMKPVDLSVAPATEETVKDSPLSKENEERRKKFFDEIRKPMVDVYYQFCGDQKVVYLRRLFIQPEYQRKGIGRALLQWGIDKADEEGLLSWLISSADGHRLYLQAGWEDRGVQHFPQWDCPPHHAMLRKPRGGHIGLK